MDIGRAKHHSKSPSWAEHLKDAFYEGLSQFMYVSRHSCEQWLRYMMLNGQWMNGHWTLTKERALAVQTNNEHCTKFHFGPQLKNSSLWTNSANMRSPLYWTLCTEQFLRLKEGLVSWRILEAIWAEEKAYECQNAPKQEPFYVHSVKEPLQGTKNSYSTANWCTCT